MYTFHIMTSRSTEGVIQSIDVYTCYTCIYIYTIFYFLTYSSFTLRDKLVVAFSDVAWVRLAGGLTTLRGGSGNLARSKSVISIIFRCNCMEKHKCSTKKTNNSPILRSSQESQISNLLRYPYKRTSASFQNVARLVFWVARRPCATLRVLRGRCATRVLSCASCALSKRCWRRTCFSKRSCALS